MRMIIVGASGTIGSALLATARETHKDVIGTCHNRERQGLLSYDMRKQRLEAVIPGGIGPQDTVYLFSAYTNVAWIYANQDKAAELNLHATKQLIDEAVLAGARIIFMSSTEVFDGEGGNYNEGSLPDPRTVYGRMKLEIEEYLSKQECRSCIVRTGWNVSWDLDSPCVITLTYRTLLNPGAQMAKDNVFSIVDVTDTSKGLLRLLNRPDITSCHLVSAPAVVRAELASMIMEFSQFKGSMSYKTVLFSDIPYIEKRSRDTHLDNSLAVTSLEMDFKHPTDIIRQKVELLDRHQVSVAADAAHPRLFGLGVL